MLRGSAAWNSRDSRVTQRMSALTVTSALCWLPASLLVLSALCGVTSLVDVQQPTHLLVVVLLMLPPLNAGLNPVLYVIVTRQFRVELKTLCLRVQSPTSTQRQFNRDDATSLNGRLVLSGVSDVDTRHKRDNVTTHDSWLSSVVSVLCHRRAKTTVDDMRHHRSPGEGASDADDAPDDVTELSPRISQTVCPCHDLLLTSRSQNGHCSIRHNADCPVRVFNLQRPRTSGHVVQALSNTRAHRNTKSTRLTRNLLPSRHRDDVASESMPVLVTTVSDDSNGNSDQNDSSVIVVAAGTRRNISVTHSNTTDITYIDSDPAEGE